MTAVVLTSLFWFAFYAIYTRPALRAKLEAEAKAAYTALTKKKEDQ
jgi:hypothetical protein